MSYKIIFQTGFSLFPGGESVVFQDFLREKFPGLRREPLPPFPVVAEHVHAGAGRTEQHRVARAGVFRRGPDRQFEIGPAVGAGDVCRKCGAVYDLEGVEYDASLDEKIGVLSGHQVDRHDLVFSGICTHCATRH